MSLNNHFDDKRTNDDEKKADDREDKEDGNEFISKKI